MSIDLSKCQGGEKHTVEKLRLVTIGFASVADTIKSGHYPYLRSHYRIFFNVYIVAVSIFYIFYWSLLILC